MKCNKETVCIQEMHNLIWIEVGEVRVPEKQGEDPTISSWFSKRGAVPHAYHAGPVLYISSAKH